MTVLREQPGAYLPAPVIFSLEDGAPRPGTRSSGSAVP